jgi:hypothetical protein
LIKAGVDRFGILDIDPKGMVVIFAEKQEKIWKKWKIAGGGSKINK